MTDLRLLIHGLFKVATLIHIWVDWFGHPGVPSGLPGHLENPVLSLDIPGFCVIILRSATQAQRDHKIIHARNFRVQPQAIMGSSIVE